MTLITDESGFDYEIHPLVDVVWALRTWTVLPDGTETESELADARSRVAIEHVIDDRMTDAGDDLVRVTGTQWERCLHLRDGSVVKFWIILEVADWRCMDCSVDLRDGLNEYYFLHDDLWLSVVPDRVGMLCVGCLEERLGRLLTAADFKPTMFTFKQRQPFSERLSDRLGRTSTQVSSPLPE